MTAGRTETVLRVAIPLMAIAAVVWLGYEFWRLLFQQGVWGAVDLRYIQGWVKDWFSPAPPSGLYPPATYTMLWPFMGWLAFTPARWLWAATALASLIWLGNLAVRHSLAATPRERAAAFLMPLSMYASGAAIGNGQLIVHVMPVLVAGLVLLTPARRTWGRDLVAAALVVAAFVKPSISAPFFWIVIFVPGSVRPALLVTLGYAGVTLFSSAFKDAGVVSLLSGWVARGSYRAALPEYGNVSNVHVWLSTLGLETWIVPASLLLVAALGVWVYRHRHVDLWLLLGVTAYVARFWAYHSWYDDLLLLLPMIALCRLTRREPATAGERAAAAVLLAFTMLFVLAPGGLFLLPPLLVTWYVAAQVTIWIIGCALLAFRARHDAGTPSLVEVRMR
jgi:hypothetical protein